MSACDLSNYFINSLMKAGPAGSSVCPVYLCTMSDQQLHNVLVTTINRCWETVAGRYVNLAQSDSPKLDNVQNYTCIQRAGRIICQVVEVSPSCQQKLDNCHMSVFCCQVTRRFPLMC